MLYTTLHNRILRLVLAVLGELIAAAALNLFIVPLSLYTGGLLGFCQLVRTLLQDFLGVSFGAYDIAGVLYFLLNIPLLMIGYRNLGRGLAVRTIICTVSYCFLQHHSHSHAAHCGRLSDGLPAGRHPHRDRQRNRPHLRRQRRRAGRAGTHHEQAGQRFYGG